MTLHAAHSPTAVAPPAIQKCVARTDIRFVEFFGLPGIGKSTASSLLAKQLLRKGFKVDEARLAFENRTLIGRQAFRAGIAAPRLADRDARSLLMRIARFVSEGGQESAVDRLRVTWNLCAAVAYVLDQRSRSTSITVVDQGLLQGFWSVLLKSRRRRTSEAWHDILSAIGVDDTIFVHLRGKPMLARNRLLTRSDRSSRMQRAPAQSEAELWLRADRAYREIADDLAKGSQAAVPVLAVVEIDASAGPEEVAERVAEAVLSACADGHRFARSGTSMR